jgi:hypothetical protein
MKDKENPYITGSNNVPTKEELDRRNKERLTRLSEIKRGLYDKGFWVPKKTEK